MRLVIWSSIPLFLLTCKTTEQQGHQVVEYQKIALLEKTGCLGTCPVYEIAVFSNNDIGAFSIMSISLSSFLLVRMPKRMNTMTTDIVIIVIKREKGSLKAARRKSFASAKSNMLM